MRADRAMTAAYILGPARSGIEYGVPGSHRGLVGRLGQHAWRLAAAVTTSVVTTAGTYYSQLHRGRLTDVATLQVGDILLYQARGEEIRRSIADAILAADAAAKADLKRGVTEFLCKFATLCL